MNLLPNPEEYATSLLLGDDNVMRVRPLKIGYANSEEGQVKSQKGRFKMLDPEFWQN